MTSDGVVVGWDDAWSGLPQVHNSDISLFLKCRRQWNWLGRQRQWLQPTGEQRRFLWFGTGFHFALEDFHGYQYFSSPGDALWAYAVAFPENVRPADWRMDIEKGEQMLAYYADQWMTRRQRLETVWVGNVPQCEVDFAVKVPGMDLVFAGTFDRVVLDREGRLWILDWKTAARMETAKWENDTQITRYTWAASQIYNQPCEGVILVQFKKAYVQRPAILKRKRKDGSPEVSKNKQIPTTYALYVDTLMEVYGEIPMSYNDHLNWLVQQEDENGDAYIRWDFVRRSKHFRETEPARMRLVLRDMFSDPPPSIYPNPSPYNCGYCDVRTACLALDDGLDYKEILATGFESRHGEDVKSWRDRIIYPDDPRYQDPPRRERDADDEMTGEELMEMLVGGLQD